MNQHKLTWSEAWSKIVSDWNTKKIILYYPIYLNKKLCWVLFSRIRKWYCYFVGHWFPSSNFLLIVIASLNLGVVHKWSWTFFDPLPLHIVTLFITEASVKHCWPSPPYDIYGRLLNSLVNISAWSFLFYMNKW